MVHRRHIPRFFTQAYLVHNLGRGTRRTRASPHLGGGGGKGRELSGRGSPQSNPSRWAETKCLSHTGRKIPSPQHGARLKVTELSRLQYARKRSARSYFMYVHILYVRTS